MIRPALAEDLSALSDIYNDAITETEATCYLTPQSASERQRWWEAHQDARYPILVAADAGEVQGYASLSEWMPGPVYARTVEASVFLKAGVRGAGLGTRLLQALLTEGRRLEHHVIIARIWSQNAASLALCRKCGFEIVGIQREVGQRHGVWQDCVLLQLILPCPHAESATANGA